MIAALKQAIAIYANDPEWARVRPPLVEFTTEQAKLLAAELKADRLRDERRSGETNQETRKEGNRISDDDHKAKSRGSGDGVLPKT